MTIITIENEFDLWGSENWYKHKGYKNYIDADIINHRFSVIPKLDNLEKRLSLLVTATLDKIYGLGWNFVGADFIMELPKCFEPLTEQISNLYFDIKLENRIFRGTLDRYNQILLRDAGKYDKEAIEIEEIYDMKKIFMYSCHSKYSRDFWGTNND